MKLVVQNPHFLSDTRGTRVHDYVIELLIRFRPAVRIWPLDNLHRWFRFLRLKKLPLTGWTYVFSESDLRNYDVWLNFNGKAMLGTRHDPMPWGFNGLKLLHLMDYSYNPQEDEARARRLGVDYVFGYARHDQHCGFFRQMHPFLQGRVVPLPFGYLPRFRETIPFEKKENRCSVMGAVVPLASPSSQNPAEVDYLTYFQGKECAHEMRWLIRNHTKPLDEWIASFLPKPPETRSWSYDSALELNRHRFFLNDDSIMHYPPARTYEGLVCGSIMLAPREPVYDDFGFKDGENCLLFQPGKLDDMLRVLREAIKEPERTRALHDRTRIFADRFSHRNVGVGLYNQIELIWNRHADDAIHYWAREATPKA
jgi:hypothetical protein